MNASINSVGATFSILLVVGCTQIGARDSDTGSAHAVHDVTFYPDGSDDGVLIGTYHSGEKTITTLFGEEEMYGVVVGTGNQSVFLVNATDGKAVEAVEFPVGESMQAEAFQQPDDSEANSLTGIVEIDPDGIRDALAIESRASYRCRTLQTKCQKRKRHICRSGRGSSSCFVHWEKSERKLTSCRYSDGSLKTVYSSWTGRSC